MGFAFFWVVHAAVGVEHPDQLAPDALDFLGLFFGQGLFGDGIRCGPLVFRVRLLTGLCVRLSHCLGFFVSGLQQHVEILVLKVDVQLESITALV